MSRVPMPPATEASGTRSSVCHPGDIAWRELDHRGRIAVIKHGRHRTVYRVDSGHGTYFLKQFRVTDWRTWVKRVWGRNPAKREAVGAELVRAAGIPTYRTLAVGISPTLWPREQFLATAAIPNARALDEILSRPAGCPTGPERTRLIERAAVIVARLHSHGLHHADLHVGNILLQSTDAEPELYLIDLQSVDRVRLHERMRWQSLVSLWHSVATLSTRTDRLRFWLAYHAALSPTNAPAGESIQSRFRSTSPFFQAGLRTEQHRIDRAWRRGNRHVRKLRVSMHEIRALAGVEPLWLARVSSDPETVLSSVPAIKESRRHRVGSIQIPVSSRHVAAYWKRIDYGSSLRYLFRFLVPTSIRRAWDAGHALLRRGIRTPRPLLMIDGVRRGATSSGHLVTESIPNAVTLAEALHSCVATLGASSRVLREHRLVEQTARILQRLHSHRAEHRDLKLGNWLVSTHASQESQPQDSVWLIDLDAIRWRWWGVSRARRMQNLARMAASCIGNGVWRSSLGRRFLKAYLDAYPSVRADSDWKTWFRGVADHVRRKVALNQKRGRPLD